MYDIGRMCISDDRGSGEIQEYNDGEFSTKNLQSCVMSFFMCS